ncbi:alpha-ketoglutarate-dependent dioxygenase AlkB [Leptospira levettii]|uniref:Alpha-ketoglutarate-dependent dioxygenase AlkB n=1 Tax=Leptospira levettii TaxID=2023178 RepID=A0ABY2MMV5_9LEPT|nr:alpha-ketoglutarate-dependent dioxygenase AlkB [Leptospira levettii]PKA27181.1 alpha-ketoglutarate-dependent dioxygenase AlkB [Leptospira sp. mixed culture ATI2-C-A1]TGL70017.1 alpha-ketoglutarate-dependent dioxygenase AlkB [Leptospira levettii]TGM24876.1 alpha-ketoglutarate-dependent dioxygenase AlkB [Leptospira levettii]TGM75796.1 alpha-ketoglutarate-dependent dioxygenase AlkB [Leptospira levettii]TGM84731.1 alpha-ketoglutarate-dependent dioxygenase AlkB [Leptospira levettii]
MNLFQQNPTTNLLPFDGTLLYIPDFLDSETSQIYFDTFQTSIEWKQDEAILYGKHILTKRSVAWYADNGFSYRYSGTTKKAIPWTKELLTLKEQVETKTDEKFNSCLLNLYHDGSEGMAWHSDDETSLKPNSTIASVSLGIERIFRFKHKKKNTLVELRLEPGSLLLMKDEIQIHWLHSLPKTLKIKRPRINLTFRQFGNV